MELERLSVALRPRNPWEAIDLGVRFALSRARPLYAVWLTVTLPVATLLWLIFGLWLESTSWALLIMWWLKPAFDRVALHVVSRAVFGEIPSLRETLRALPGLLIRSRLLAALTWQRLSITRATLLPVDQLEGLRGKAGRERRRLLGRRIGSAASWHTLAWLHLETILSFGLLGLILLLIPDGIMPSNMNIWKLFTAPPLWFSSLTYLQYLLCSLFLEPLYVAGGFMLYLKRRTDLEAWDVELQFRRLARAHANRNSTSTIPLAAGLSLLLGLMLSLGTPSVAEASKAAYFREQQIQKSGELIEQVLQDPAFGQEEVERQLRWRKAKDAKKDPFQFPAWLSDLFESLGSVLKWIGQGIAMLGRIGGWLLILATLGLLLYLASRFGWLRNKAEHSPPPGELAGFDIRPQSLPDDPAAAAHSLLKSGDTRAALSLLFRASLSRLAHRDRVAFARGDTEGDCLERTHRQAPAHAAYLSRLLGCWQRLAYAHQSIGTEEIEALCAGWQKHFGEAAHG